jgi:glycosyltransferase involved in cell wall biosynthesis
MARILYHHRIRADDGQAVHVRELIFALRRQGHQVYECALVPKADPEGQDAPRSARFWQGLRLPRSAQETLEILYNRGAVRRLCAAAREFRPDFLYERHSLHCTAGLQAAKRLDIPLLLEVNAPLCDEAEGLGLLRFKQRARRIERHVLGAADRVLAVTTVLGDILVDMGANRERLRINANGAEPGRYGDRERQGATELRRRLGLGDFVLGFSGYMRPWHRLDLVLDAMGRPGLKSVHLLLVGRGPALDGLLEKARQMGLAERIHATGEVSREDLPLHVCAFDAALIPAINPYASPLKLFEALAAGVVAVAPRQANLTEILESKENGLLFEPGSAASLGACLEDLVANPARARELGEAGRRSLVAHDWTWAGNARRVVAAYQELQP